MRVPESYEPGRVVLLRLRGLGDVVLSSAVVHALALRWPRASVDFLSAKASRGLLETDTRLDRVFLLDPPGNPFRELARARPTDVPRARTEAAANRGERPPRLSTGRIAAAAAWLREEPADLVVDLFSNPLTAILTALSGARYRIGLDKRLRRFAYNVRVPRFLGGAGEDHRYARDVQLDFLRGAGIRWEGEARAGVAVASADAARAREILARLGYGAEEPIGMLLPGGTWASKRWSVSGFAEVGRALHERLGTPPLVVWGPPEEGDARAIADALGKRGRLAHPTTLRQMAALLGAADVVVSTDCLGRHLAVVQEVPTLGIFGSTDPRDWTPPDGPHATVGGPGVPGGLAALRPESVIRELERLLDRTLPRRMDSPPQGP